MKALKSEKNVNAFVKRELNLICKYLKPWSATNVTVR